VAGRVEAMMKDVVDRVEQVAFLEEYNCNNLQHDSKFRCLSIGKYDAGTAHRKVPDASGCSRDLSLN